MTSTQVLTTKVGPCGGAYGNVKDMKINGITRIVKLSICHFYSIDALTITFLRNGQEESTEKWGRQGMSTLTEVHLQTSEYITSVKGHVGTNCENSYVWISSLTFETNLRSIGPYGNPQGSPFELPAIRGQIIGFHAHARSCLYALGVYVQEPLANTPQSTNAAIISTSLVCSNFSRTASTHEVLTKKVGPCGGTSGTVKDMNINGVTHISKINIHHSSAIDALTITFLRNGHEESTEQWGTQGGTSTEFHLQASEYITSIKGHVGTYNSNYRICSLKFETNLQSFGPYGREEGYAFELPASMGQIIGFHACCGESLYALGVYVQDRKEGVTKELEDCKQIENLEKENKLQKTELKDKEAEFLEQLQGLRSSNNDLQKKLEYKIESLENENELLHTKLEHMEAEHLMHSQELSNNLDSKDDMQKKHESKIGYLKKKNELLQTKFKHTEAGDLMHLKELRAELDSKDDLQKKLESINEYLENQNELLHTKFKHTEMEYMMHLQELRAESDNKDDLQKKLESKIMDLENKNELMQTKEKDLKDAIKELLQSRERFVHHYQVDNMTGRASDDGNTGGSTGTGWAGTK